MNRDKKQINTILSIDQGTSGTKALVFDAEGKLLSKATAPLKTLYLEGGKVEQEPESIYENVLSAVKECLDAFRKSGGEPDSIISCGISNQRETFLVWDRSGNPLHNAIVWQCKRSIGVCEKLIQQGLEPIVKAKTGLIIDPYFSGTKLIWLYENNPAVKSAVDRGEAYFGTVDTWLLFRLTKGEQYLTDYTNASRTLFFNLESLDWDLELLGQFGLSGLNLPALKASSASFGFTDFRGLLGREIPVTAMIGDSHAAAFGEECFAPGTAKATLGTGCSVLMNIGSKPKLSKNGMMTTVCWSLEGRVDFALEGVIVSCGATIEWLKNELGIIADSRETAEMALSLQDNNGVYLIPAFSGLGAPHWEMNRKASIVGLTFDCNRKHVVRAALESIPYQIKDVIAAMEKDAAVSLDLLMIDGGISANRFVTGFLSGLLGKPVVNVGIADVSGLGAAYLSGLYSGVFKDLEQIKSLQKKKQIGSGLPDTALEKAYSGWKKAISGG